VHVVDGQISDFKAYEPHPTVVAAVNTVSA
jgi:hypothetical protein